MKHIEIYDTTLRDGAQGEGINFSLRDKLMIAARLAEVGVDYVEGGYPLSNEKDEQFFKQIREMETGATKIAAFGMTRRRGMAAADDPGMQALVSANSPVITVVGKTSEFHVAEVLRVSPEENLAMIAESVAFLVGQGREVIYDAEHFFDGWKENAAFAAETITVAADAGARTIVLCDTNGGSLPEEIAQLTIAARDVVDVPIGIHCHNDCGVAVANTLAAVEAGAIHVQGTINGIGERCGNADLIAVIANLSLKKSNYKVLTGSGVEHLTELSRFVYETANMLYTSGQPFVGKSAFAHKGGMHAHAVARVAESYEHIQPEKVGNARRVLVSELSGRSNIRALTAKHDIGDDPALMEKILARVVELENQGYQFEAAGGSFDLLVRREAGTFQPHFERINYHAKVETDAGGETTNEATVKLKIGETIRHEVAEGDGPVNALDTALRKALSYTFPNLASMHLLDYKVRVINSEAATAACVRVIIESTDDHDSWGTVGVHENVIEASWQALVDSFEYKLYKDELKS